MTATSTRRHRPAGGLRPAPVAEPRAADRRQHRQRDEERDPVVVDLAVAHRDHHPLRVEEEDGGAEQPGRPAGGGGHGGEHQRPLEDERRAVCVGVGRCSTRPIEQRRVPLGRDVGVRADPGGGEEDVDRDEQVGDRRGRPRSGPAAPGRNHQRPVSGGRRCRRCAAWCSMRRPPGRTRRRRGRCSRRSGSPSASSKWRCTTCTETSSGRRRVRLGEGVGEQAEQLGVLLAAGRAGPRTRRAAGPPGRRTAAPPRRPRSRPTDPGGDHRGVRVGAGRVHPERAEREVVVVAPEGAGEQQGQDDEHGARAGAGARPGSAGAPPARSAGGGSREDCTGEG